MRPIWTLTAILIMGALIMVGCSDEGSTHVSITRPTITLVSPEDGDTDVNLNPLIEVRFSEAMDVASLDSIRIKGVSSSYVGYDDTLFQATLYLAELLEPGTVYELRIHSAVMSQRGSNLAGDSVVSFTTGPLDCEHTRDYLEPNDSPSSGAEITTDRLYPSLTLCLDDDEWKDYYRFSLTDTVMVTFRSIGHGDMPTMLWYTSLMRPPGSVYVSLVDSLRSGGEVVPHYSCLPGEYIVGVHRDPEGVEVVAYDFIMETSGPCPDDQYEDNDFYDEAILVTEGLLEGLRGCSYDRDYFEIDLAAGETLTLTVTQVNAPEEWGGVFLFGPPGRVDEDSGKGRPLEVSYTTDEEGTYRWNVIWYGDGVEYSLNVDVTPDH